MFFDSYKVKTIATLCLAMFMLLSVVIPVFAQDQFGLEGLNEDGTFGTKDLKSTVGSIIKVALSFVEHKIASILHQFVNMIFMIKLKFFIRNLSFNLIAIFGGSIGTSNQNVVTFGCVLCYLH